MNLNLNSSDPLNITWVCHTSKYRRTIGVFLGDNPFRHAGPILFAQITVASLLSAILQYILTPLGESSFVSMILVGFLMGPSFWGEDNVIAHTLYPLKSFYVNETFSFFGAVLFIFVVGSKMDLGMLARTGKKAVAIGILSFVVPLALNLIVASIIRSSMDVNNINDHIYHIAAFQAVSSYHVIGCLLADLNLLNSELGRLAASASMISGICSWALVGVLMTARQSKLSSTSNVSFGIFTSAAFLAALIFLVLRRIMIWMVRNTAEGKPIKEAYIFSVFIMLLFVVFFSQVIGQHLFFGPVLLGAAIPDGPPLGSAVVEKVETFVSTMFLPSFFVYTVTGINVFSIRSGTFLVASIMGISSCIGKIIGVMLPSIICKMSPMDSFALGLIMSCQGITDVMLLQHAQLLFLLEQETYSIMVIIMVVLTGAITPVIKVIYKPSKRLLNAKKRNIQHTSPTAELRLLACIYSQDNTPSIISLLEVSNPTTKHPICCYVIHLVEIAGRLSPLFIFHRPGRRISRHSHYSEHIINAFRSYENHANGSVVVNLFTAVAPFASIHEEVWGLALEKRTSMVIVPFHKQWKLHGAESLTKVRSVNHKILTKCPCSVGILIDRGTLDGSKTGNNFLCSIGIFFVEGKDDREALAYTMRMAEHPNVSITVIHLKEAGLTNQNSQEAKLDNAIINEFKIATIGKQHHFYREEVVNDGIELVTLIRHLANAYDLILVGRQHDTSTPIFAGLDDWNECPELGVIGDMLASEDSLCRVSVLVVQQQAQGEDLTNIHYLVEDSVSGPIFQETRKPSSKVWPEFSGPTKKNGKWIDSECAINQTFPM